MNFNGKTAFVTGAARGIGMATAIGFAKKGANVCTLIIFSFYVINCVLQNYDYISISNGLMLR